MRPLLPLLLLLFASCGGSTPSRNDSSGGDAGPSVTEPGGPVPPETRFIDDECLVQGRTLLVVLPAALRDDLEVEALAGGWEGNVYRGRGRVDARIRKLRLLGDRIRIEITDGPVANLRVQAEGDAKLSSPTMERLDPPAELILLRPDGVLID